MRIRTRLKLICNSIVTLILFATIWGANTEMRQVPDSHTLCDFGSGHIGRHYAPPRGVDDTQCLL